MTSAKIPSGRHGGLPFGRSFLRAASGVAACLLTAALFAACTSDPDPYLTGGVDSEVGGYVKLDVKLKHTRPALLKAASADTIFRLDSVKIILSAPGSPTQTYTYPIAGRADSSSISVGAKVYALAPLKTWTAKILTIDTTLNPAHRDTVHMDSVTFTIHAADTTFVNKTINPLFSILRVRFLSTNPDSVPNGVRYLRVRVNGEVVDSLALQGSGLNAVYFPSTTVGYAVGDSGRLMKTSNGGTTWTRMASGTTRDLLSVWFTSATVGWASGESGEIRKTTNGGTSWTQETSNSTQAVKRVMFEDANKGLAFGSGGLILRTTDGGATWASASGNWFLTPSGTTSALTSLYFSSATTGWVLGASGLIRKTADGGATWTAQTSGTQQFNAVSFSGSTGYATGNGGVIYRTTNGTSWSSQTSGVSTALNGVYWNGTRGFVVGASGVIRYTTNGTSWSSRTSGTTTALYGVFFRSNSLGWVVGASGLIRKTTDANDNSWSAQTSGTTQQLNAVYFNDNSVGWVVGNGGVILKTSNAGSAWAAQASGTTQNLTSVRFVDANNGYACGAAGTILKTTNGGSTWTAQTSATGQNLAGIYPVNANAVFAVGAGGVVAKTTRGGVAVTSSSLNGAHLRSDTVYVVGDAGTALRSLDWGASWTVLTSNTTQNLNAVFSTGNYAYAVGDAGTVVTVPHDGTSTSFTVRNSATTKSLYAVWGSPTMGSTRAYAAGEDGDLRSITSATQTWSPLTSGTTETLRGVHCSGTGTACWTVGGNETVLTTTTGTSWSEQTAGAKTFDQLLTYKYLKPGASRTILIEAIDRPTLPLRGFQATKIVVVGAGRDSTITTPLAKCGYGGANPACTP